MTTPLSSVQLVSVPAAGGAEVRVFDIPYTMPVKDLSIFVTTKGAPMPAAGVDWEVFYGGTWSGGQPFAAGSTLAGGVSQGSGNLVAAAAGIAEYVHTETKIYPPNYRLGTDPPFIGPAVSLNLDNKAAVVVDLAVFFVSRQLGDFT